MKAPLFPILLSGVSLILAGHSPASGQGQARKDTFLVDPSKPVLPPAKHSPEVRAKVSREPVAEYHEMTGHLKGNFVVRLYQTSKTMDYRIDVDYEGLPGDDTVRFPDLGTAPRPVLQKGATSLSCLIGFLDNDNRFREVKLVYVTPKGNQFKITTLRHWHVTTHYRLVSQ